MGISNFLRGLPDAQAQNTAAGNESRIMCAFFMAKCWNPWSASALFAIISLVARIASKGYRGSLRNRFKSPKSPPSANFDSRVCERGQGFFLCKAEGFCGQVRFILPWTLELDGK
jgi:hypothetical protein